MQVKTFTNLEIKTIAINKETPPDLRPQIMKVRELLNIIKSFLTRY